jgi:hypothetical protein
MTSEMLSLAPYFRNGMLYFPEKTIKALVEVGLEWQVGHRATRGISLDDGESLSKLTHAIDILLGQVDHNSPFFNALTSDEAYFMLTGKPLAS